MKAASIKKYLLAGLVVWLPIIATILILRFLIDLLDQTMSLLPEAYNPEKVLGINVPGLGVILSIVVLFITGTLATNLFGQKLVRMSESILDRIPLVRSIYNATKQMIEAIVSTNSQAFRKVVLVEYPRKGLWSLAFQTGGAFKEVGDKTNQEMVTIFVPTTPNPTAGFLMMVSKEEVIELEMSVDTALKFIISLGVMQPGMTTNGKKVKIKP